MTARFAGEKELQSLLEDGYQSYSTELGSFLVPSGTLFTRDHVTLGLARFFTKIQITMAGIELISR